MGLTQYITTSIILAASGAAAAQISGDTVRIGFVTDMSGVYADIDGAGGAAAIRMAIADAGGTVMGKRVELMVADHLNKSDLASAKARAWIDQHGLDMLVGGTNSSASLAMARVAAEKKRVFFAVGAGATRLTNEECSPYTVHYAFDTVALARGTAAAIAAQGDKRWYFLSVDYAYGQQMQRDAAEVIQAAGGNVVGAASFPLAAPDFSSFLLRAQASGAQVLGLVAAGNDTVNAVRTANQFMVHKSMKIAGMAVFINDVHALGLKLAQGMYVTDGWYWDQSAASRAWARRYFAVMKRMPTMIQAANYSAVSQYLLAVAAAGTDDASRVMAQLRRTTIRDMFTDHGTIREDGRMVHDMYLMQVNRPGQARYPWDYYRLLQTIPGAMAFTTRAESRCGLWNARPAAAR